MSDPSSVDDDGLAERVTALEVRVAYQERLLGELDDVIREFCRRVETVERHIRELRDSAAPDAIGGADEPPPHY